MTKEPKEKYKFVFPNAMAKMMAKVNMRTQMESSMLSQGLLLVGLTIMAILMLWTSSDRSIFSTIMIVFNLCAAWLLMSSYLVTTYQQYTNYMEAAGYDPQAEKAKIKASGNIFKRILNAKKTKRMNKELEAQRLRETENDIEVEGRDNYGR